MLTQAPDWHGTVEASRATAPAVDSAFRFAETWRDSQRIFLVAEAPTVTQDREMLVVMAAKVCLRLTVEPHGASVLTLSWEPPHLHYNLRGHLTDGGPDLLKIPEASL